MSFQTDQWIKSVIRWWQFRQILLHKTADQQICVMNMKAAAVWMHFSNCVIQGRRISFSSDYKWSNNHSKCLKDDVYLNSLLSASCTNVFFNYTQVFSSLQTFMFWGSNVQIWHLFPLGRRTGSPTLRWNLQIKKIFYYMCCVTSRTTGLTLWNTIFSPASKCHHSILQHTGFINEPELIHRDQWSLGKNKNSSQMFNSCNTLCPNLLIQGLKTRQYLD